MSPKVQIFLMSYNRPEYVADALRSVLNQSYSPIEIIVSDNSTNDLVQKKIQSEFSNELAKVRYFRRQPSLSMAGHWNQIISEVTSSYFMMFHDDDIMKSNCVEDLVFALEKNKSAVASAGNAQIIRSTNLTDEVHNKNLHVDINFANVFDFGQRYFDAVSGGVNPFPGYMYRTMMLENIRFNKKEAGKHSDVTFLMKLLSKGSIYWVHQITLNYRIHSSNDSVGVDILALSNLVKFYNRNALKKTMDILSREFVIKNYILWLKQIGFSKFKNEHPYRFKIITLSILKYFLAHPQRFIALLLKNIF